MQAMKCTYINRKKINFTSLMLALTSYFRFKYMMIRFSRSTLISFSRPNSWNYLADTSSMNIRAIVSKGTVDRKSIVKRPRMYIYAILLPFLISSPLSSSRHVVLNTIKMSKTKHKSTNVLIMSTVSLLVEKAIEIGSTNTFQHAVNIIKKSQFSLNELACEMNKSSESIQMLKSILMLSEGVSHK